MDFLIVDRRWPGSRTRSRTSVVALVWRCLSVVLLAYLVGCQRGDGERRPAHETESGRAAAGVGGARTEVRVEEIAVLDDIDEPILGRPGRISVDGLGRFVIGDLSDRNIKIYSTDGRRVATFGTRGQGPGEFQYLMDSGVVGNRIFGYDYPGNRLNWFADDGTVLETTPLSQGPGGLFQPYSIVAADDHRFMFAQAPREGTNLLRISELDGAPVREFFPLDAKWTTPRAVWQGVFLPDHVWHQADALDGLIFSGMWGDDTLHVFDYNGTLLGTGPVDTTDPLISLPELLSNNNGRIRDPDGISIQNGNRVIRRIVATEGATVTVHVAPFNTVTGADPLDGGTLIVLRWADGELREIGRMESEWGLLGRDATGRALVMRYATQDSYAIGRVTW